MLNEIVNNAPYFLLVAVRCFALISTMPLLSTNSVSRVAKIALAGCISFIVFPTVYDAPYEFAPYSLEYLLLLLAEGLIGVITGFFTTAVFAAFSSAGQFFSLQMGFSAAEAYDALAQVENPLMGQFFNLCAMLCFLQIDGFKTLFLGGIFRSFQALSAYSLVLYRENYLSFVLNSLTDLTFAALMIALPMMGTLFLINVTMGLLSKAAPQMNLLSEGLPITILVSFFLLTLLMPKLVNYFIMFMNSGFSDLENFFAQISGGI
jgi:flagellar biosynthetic protein FliR